MTHLASSPLRAVTRSSRVLLLGLVGLGLGLGCPGCSHAPVPAEGSSTSTGRGFARPAPELGIVQAAEIAPGVYRGGQPTHEGLVTLRDRGFKTVVNLRSHHSERRQVEALG